MKHFFVIIPLFLILIFSCKKDAIYEDDLGISDTTGNYRDNYVGTYNVTCIWNSGVSNSDIEFIKPPQINLLKVKYIYDDELEMDEKKKVMPAEIIVDAGGNFTIPEQKVPYGFTVYSIKGNGTFINNTVSYDYDVYYSGTIVSSCSCSGSK